MAEEDRVHVAACWLESLDAGDQLHSEAAICMAGALQRYAADRIAGATPQLAAAGKERELLAMTDEMTSVLRESDPREPIAVAQRVFACAFKLAANLREGLADSTDGDRIEEVIQGWVSALGEALRDFVGTNYPFAESFYESYGAIPNAGITSLFVRPS
jgi:hypothetical protein